MNVQRGARVALALALVLAALAAPSAEAASRRSKSGTPKIAASIVVDMNTGTILHSEAAEQPRPPASLTKMMTLYVLFGYLRAGKITPDTELVVTSHAASQAPTKLGLKPGAKIKVTDAAKALVTQSANDAAATIAENLGGTEENFARLMTETGRRIGMTNTVFRNASGLPNDEQMSTARDMAILSAHLIHDYPEYYTVFETRYFTFKGRKYRNHNKLLFGYKGTDGIKTGYTRASGFNLAASAHRGNKHLLAVVLGGRTGSQRDAATRALLDKHFAKASETKPTDEQRVASFVGAPPPPLPAIKKPDLTLASMAPAPSPAASPAEGDIDPAPVAAPAPAPAPQPQPVLAALTSPSPAAKPATESTRVDGAYNVQVGAFTSQAEAENRLGMVQQRALDVLKGHLPFTASFMKGDQEWYRARFAGFSQDDAEAACAALKKLSLDCAIMLAE
ncbi:MAG: D-alanyl-D-alanine carboxypeptidase [Methyloceanibacter sp.]